MSGVLMLLLTAAQNAPEPVESVVFYSAAPDTLAAVAWSDSGEFGSSYGGPSSPPSVSPMRIAVNPDCTAVVCGMSDSGGVIEAWRFDPETGWGEKYLTSLSKTTVPNAITFNRAGTVVFLGYSTSPYIEAYEWDDATGFGAQYSAPASLPPGSVRAITTGLDDTKVVVGCASGTNRLLYYGWDDVTGFGSRVFKASSSRSAASLSVSPNGDAIVIGSFGTGLGSNVSAVEWDDTTGFGNFYSAPASPPSSGTVTVTFSLDGAYVIGGMSGSTIGDTYGVFSYEFDSMSGFGAKDVPDPNVADAAGVMLSGAGGAALLHDASAEIRSFNWDGSTLTGENPETLTANQAFVILGIATV